MDIGKEKAKLIGENLRKIREAKGISQEELAAKIGVAQSLLSRWERGIFIGTRSVVTFVNHFSEIADVLEISIEALVKGVVSEP